MQELLPALSALANDPPWEVLCFCAGWILHDILSPAWYRLKKWCRIFR